MQSHTCTRRNLLLGATLAAAGADSVAAATAATTDWPQWRGPNRDGVWKDDQLLDTLPGPQLPLRWRAPVAGGYSGPTVSGGRVYVTDHIAAPQSQERVHCLDAQTGKPVWTFSYPSEYGQIGYQDGPRAAVLVHDGRAYAMGAVGHLHCLDAQSGAVVWRKDLTREYQIQMPIWGTAAAPIVEAGLLIAAIGGANGACVVAWDRRTGREAWRALDDRANYSAPIVINQAGKRVLICWTGDRVVGLAPLTGKLLWEAPFRPVNMPLGLATPVIDGDLLFLSGFYDGSLLLRLSKNEPAVEQVWRRRGQNERNTDSLHCMIGSPIMRGGYIYGFDSYGELRCLNAQNGDRVWESQQAVPKARWATAHCVQNGERTWIFNERGELIIARLTPQKYEELSRAQLIKPTKGQLGERGGVCWSHPAYANRHVFARNDEEVVCASLAATKG